MKKRDFIVFDGKGIPDDRKIIDGIYTTCLAVLEASGMNPDDPTVQKVAMERALGTWKKVEEAPL